MNDRDELDEVLECASDPLCVLYNTDSMYFDPEDVALARAIRDRERRLAELAREAFKIMAQAKVLGMEDEREADWLRRYEDAIK